MGIYVIHLQLPQSSASDSKQFDERLLGHSASAIPE